MDSRNETFYDPLNLLGLWICQKIRHRRQLRLCVSLRPVWTIQKLL